MTQNRLHRLRLFLVVCLFLLASGISSAREELKTVNPLLIYEESLHANAGSVSYAATVAVTTQFGSSQYEYLRLGHRERFQFSTPNGVAIVVTEGAKRAGKGAVPKGFFRSTGQNLPPDFELLTENYNIELVGNQQLLGRQTSVLSVASRHVARPARTVWIDDETGVPLKIEEYDVSGRLIFRQETMTFNVAPIASESTLLEIEAVLGGRTDKQGPPALLSLQQAQSAAGFHIVLPSTIPVGYRLAGIRIPRDQPGVVHILFQDGLGVISLYQRQVPWWARKSTKPVDGEVLDWEMAGRHYTLVGDASAPELLQMANSIGE